MAEVGGLIELSTITDFYADDVHHIELIGDNCRMVYFRWRQIEGVWRQVAVERAIVRPIRSLHLPLHAWGAPVTRSPDHKGQTLHS